MQLFLKGPRTSYNKDILASLNQSYTEGDFDVNEIQKRTIIEW